MCKICICLALIILPVGVLYLVGNDLLYILFHHESRYATIFQCLGVCYLLFSKRSIFDKWVSFAIILASILSLRSKALVFMVFFGAFVFFYDNIKFRRMFTLRNFIILSIAIGLSWYLVEEKVDKYFVYGAKNDYARPALYKGAFKILTDYPVLGTGFGSYAEFASSEYYSPLYVKYKLNHIWGLSSDIKNFVSDTFFPSLAQYGLLGIFFFFMFWYKRVKIANHQLQLYKDRYQYSISILIVIFFFIESSVDSTFTHNRGMFMMLLLAINQTMNDHSIELTLKKLRQKIQ